MKPWQFVWLAIMVLVIIAVLLVVRWVGQGFNRGTGTKEYGSKQSAHVAKSP